MAIEVGSKLQGKVTGLTNFGAFVELPGGHEVEVKVLQIEPDGKIGLSIKKAKDQPAKTFVRKPRPQKREETVQVKETFEQKMSKFLKDSEDRLTSLKRHTESKRGGRGARRG